MKDEKEKIIYRFLPINHFFSHKISRSLLITERLLLLKIVFDVNELNVQWGKIRQEGGVNWKKTDKNASNNTSDFPKYFNLEMKHLSAMKYAQTLRSFHRCFSSSLPFLYCFGLSRKHVFHFKIRFNPFSAVWWKREGFPIDCLIKHDFNILRGFNI
jgi:hypothetical protein